MVTIKALGLAILLSTAQLTLWAQQNNSTAVLAAPVARRLLARLISTMTARLCNSATRAIKS